MFSKLGGIWTCTHCMDIIWVEINTTCSCLSHIYRSSYIEGTWAKPQFQPYEAFCRNTFTVLWLAVSIIELSIHGKTFVVLLKTPTVSPSEYSMFTVQEVNWLGKSHIMTYTNPHLIAVYMYKYTATWNFLTSSVTSIARSLSKFFELSVLDSWNSTSLSNNTGQVLYWLSPSLSGSDPSLMCGNSTITQ